MHLHDPAIPPLDLSPTKYAYIPKKHTEACCTSMIHYSIKLESTQMNNSSRRKWVCGLLVHGNTRWQREQTAACKVDRADGHNTEKRRLKGGHTVGLYVSKTQKEAQLMYSITDQSRRID